MNNHENTVIIIVGPTASGKTSLSLQLAKHFNTSIISADSRQCFRELNIGVAKPSDEELKSVKHYFINSHSIFENVTAQTFEDYALNAVNEIFQINKYAVMVGGTGLYIKAFTEGLDVIPEASTEIRQSIIYNYNKNGLIWLQNELKEKDPSFWRISEQQNPQRLMRALEVLYATGKSIASFRAAKKTKKPFRIIKAGIDLPKKKLHQNIDTRTEGMMEKNLLKEAVSLLPYRHLNALQTVGYKELFEYLDGKNSLSEAVEQIKTHTRQYAKRQLTWFKKDKEILWLQGDDYKSSLLLSIKL